MDDDPPGLKRLPLLRGDHTPIELNYCVFWKKEKSNYYIKIMDTVRNSEVMQKQWYNYQKDFEYAANIAFKDVCDSVVQLLNLLMDIKKPAHL